MRTTDDELTGPTLAQLIEQHGSSSCGDPMCKIDAAHAFVAGAKKDADPWGEVVALHVHTSLLLENAAYRDIEESAYRQRFGLFLFEMVNRLGGIAFMPTFETIAAKPGMVRIENNPDGGHVLRIVNDRTAKAELS